VAHAHDQLWNAGGGGGSRPCPPSKGCRGGRHTPAQLRAAGRAANAPAKQKRPAGQPLALGGRVGQEQE
jgi:hypothetical protein